MSLPQLWPKHHRFLPLIFQCHGFQKAPHPCRLPQVCFRHWNLRFGPVRAQCSGTLAEDPQSTCLVSVTTTRGSLVCVNRLGRELLYELVMKGKISGPFFFKYHSVCLFWATSSLSGRVRALLQRPGLSRHSGSGAAARSPACLTAGGIVLPLAEVKPGSAVWKGRFLAPEPRWKSLDFFFPSFYIVSLSSPSLTLQES